MACDSPIPIKFKTPLRLTTGGLQYYFPGDCGKCLKCLTKRKAQWSFRMTEEKRQSFSSYFITLTYNDNHLPWGNGVPSINKQDHFDFIKKLKNLETSKSLAERNTISKEENDRKYYGIPETGRLKYYGVSEYGDEKGRSHWHYILFNVRDSNNIDLAWTPTLYDQYDQPYNGNSKGKTEIDPDVNVNNIDYVLKYMIKDHSNQDYENRAKEVSFMSKGLGISAADKEFLNHFTRVEQNQVITERGTKIPIPRYYRKKFMDDSTREAKNQYIATEIQQAKQIQELHTISMGGNPYKIEKLQKDTRLHILTSRPKRNYE